MINVAVLPAVRFPIVHIFVMLLNFVSLVYVRLKIVVFMLVFTVTFSAVLYPLFVTVIVYVSSSSKYKTFELVSAVIFKFATGVTVMFSVSLLFDVFISTFVVFTFTMYVVFSIICTVMLMFTVWFAVRFPIYQ